MNYDRGMQNAATQQQYNSGMANAVAPREPSTSERAQEALGYLFELEQVQAAMRERLFGPFPQESQPQAKEGRLPCLDEMLAMLCQKSAILLSEAKSIHGRL